MKKAGYLGQRPISLWLMVYWLTGLLVIGLDQLTKFFASNKLLDPMGVFIIDSNWLTINLRYSLNKFLSFSIPAPQLLIIIISALIIGVLIWLLIKKIKTQNFRYSMGLVILIAAALSNLADRIISGAVVDFISIKIFSFQWAIFNVADIFITASIIFLLIIELFIKKRPLPGSAGDKESFHD
jgi:signal peptidase II